MSLTQASRYLERIQFFNGQRLFASDLQALEAFHREMRWLHNQSLHQPGVGSGFAIAGAKGDREVTIRPGYAIDDLGREIVLTEVRVEPVPPVANDGFGLPAVFDLTVAYPSEDDLKAAETREAVCAAEMCRERGAVRLREEPVFCWVRLGPAPDRLPENPSLRDELQRGRRIRLARAEVLNCKLESPLAIAVRRNARPPDRPYFMAGRSGPGGWTVKGPVDTAGFGFEISTTVDTSCAKFRTAPRYFAHVLGPRKMAFAAGPNAELMVDGFLSYYAPDQRTDRLNVSVLIPLTLFERLMRSAEGAGGGMRADQIAAILTSLVNATPSPDRPVPPEPWLVEWIGVEG
ncbi:MAG: hypothetical protein ACRD44_05655 [Bryobacteraceae bacterium]